MGPHQPRTWLLASLFEPASCGLSLVFLIPKKRNWRTSNVNGIDAGIAIAKARFHLK